MCENRTLITKEQGVRNGYELRFCVGIPFIEFVEKKGVTENSEKKKS